MNNKLATIRMSYVYILDDEITDLLNPNSNSEKGNLSLHSDGPASFEDLMIVTIHSLDKFMEYYHRGLKNLKEEEDGSFGVKGRVSTILTLELEFCDVKPDGLGDVKSSRL